MVNASSIFLERIYIAEERGIRNGIRVKRENRLSTDDLTIKAKGLSEQSSMYYGELIKQLSREDRNCRRKGIRGGIGEYGKID